MKQIQIKVGRDLVWVDDHDVAMDNGACIQLITKQKRSGYGSIPLQMSKKLFKEFKTLGFIYTNDEIQKYYEPKFIIPCKFYKFNIEKMAAVGYETREK